MRVHIVGGDHLIENMFNSLDMGFEITENADESDILVFTGGEDVCPALYGDKILNVTHFNYNRDAKEVAIYNKYPDKIKIGICRGGQFLNVMNKGTMWQDVNNHTRSHKMFLVPKGLVEGDQIEVTSTHHQMMIMGPEAKSLGYAHEATEKLRGEKEIHSNVLSDTEVLWYEKTKSFCFQPHPEYGHEPTKDVFVKLLKHVGIV